MFSVLNIAYNTLTYCGILTTDTCMITVKVFMLADCNFLQIYYSWKVRGFYFLRILTFSMKCRVNFNIFAKKCNREDSGKCMFTTTVLAS